MIWGQSFNLLMPRFPHLEKRKTITTSHSCREDQLLFFILYIQINKTLHFSHTRLFDVPPAGQAHSCPRAFVVLVLPDGHMTSFLSSFKLCSNITFQMMMILFNTAIPSHNLQIYLFVTYLPRKQKVNKGGDICFIL